MYLGSCRNLSIHLSFWVPGLGFGGYSGVRASDRGWDLGVARAGGMGPLEWPRV